MSEFEGSGNNLSVNTSPLLRTKYIELRNLPLGRSGKHSETSETLNSPDALPAVADIIKQSSFLSDLLSTAFEQRLEIEFEDTESSDKVTENDEELEFSDCQTEVVTATGAESAATGVLTVEAD